MALSNLQGRLLGVDYGMKVIGLAVSDPSGMLARPLQLIYRKSKKEDFAKINTAIREQKTVALVVGLPESPPAITDYTQADRVRLWASRLAAAVNVPVMFWNERYSSWEAEEALAAARKARPERIDAHAAAIILQEFLDAHRDGTPWPDAVLPSASE